MDWHNHGYIRLHIRTLTDVQAYISVVVLAPSVQSRGDELRLVVTQHGLHGVHPLLVDLQQQKVKRIDQLHR